jgi:hypothetical protein
VKCIPLITVWTLLVYCVFSSVIITVKINSRYGRLNCNGLFVQKILYLMSGKMLLLKMTLC